MKPASWFDGPRAACGVFTMARIIVLRNPIVDEQ
jgi:hypothetical protein